MNKKRESVVQGVMWILVGIIAGFMIYPLVTGQSHGHKDREVREHQHMHHE